MPTRTEAIRRFLYAKTHLDLASLYEHSMECQVNVAQDGGERVDKEFNGRVWQEWTDGTQRWKSFRIPYNAATNPEYGDVEMTYDLVAHAEAIGMTGWDWANKLSRWVGFDFDAITGHAERHQRKLSNEELEELKQAAIKIPWVTVRKSTGGKGLHLHVFLEPVKTANHNEHAAIGRAVLGKLSALTGYDFNSKVDICGGNMWVWHRKMSKENDGLKLIKKGELLDAIPINWRDHIKVVAGRRQKTMPKFLNDEPLDLSNSPVLIKIDQTDAEKQFEELTGQRTKTPLDEGHKKLLHYLLEQNRTASWWDSDNWMLVTHTFQLSQAHRDLGMRGVFKTLSENDQNGTDYNCFCFPGRRGAWTVRRYGPGVAEAETWSQDSSGYTKCLLNHEPDLLTASRAYGGQELEKGGFHFRQFEVAQQSAQMLGAQIDLPNDSKWAYTREAWLKPHKDGRLIVSIDRKETDPVLPGWSPVKLKWVKIFNVRTTAPVEQETGNYDDMLRHIVSESGDDSGWVAKSESGSWLTEPLRHVQATLKAQGLNAKDTEILIGQCVRKPWQLVNIPFREEYPGDRKWNRNAAQFRFLPNPNTENLQFPHWSKILAHCGVGLDEAVKQNGWCSANAIINGADYLKVWMASLLQAPLEPLPYLFFYGDQDNGKSSFHEAIALLVTKGYTRAETALTTNFNAELEGAICCVIEEMNLNQKEGKKSDAYNKMKDLVTAKFLSVHRKGQTPYMIQNSTHWIHTANDPTFCPIFTGDTRVTMIHVPELDPMDLIPKSILMSKLEAEGPDFLASLLRVEIPTPLGRLNLPVIATEEKLAIQKSSRNAVEVFLEEVCFDAPGSMELYGLLWERFQEFCDPSELGHWTQNTFGKALPHKYPKGRSRSDNQVNIGNISLTPKPELADKPRLIAFTNGSGNTVLVPEVINNGNNH